MKLENYEGTADTFTFPHNSRVFDDTVDKFVDQRDFNYAFSYFGVTHPVKSRRIITINGFFDDSGTGDKVSNVQDLIKHGNENKIKKLYFSDSNFYIVIPTGAKVTHTGGRTMFRDYVANFVSPFGILFSNTQRQGDKNSVSANAGNVFTPIEKIEVTGLTSDTTYTIKDTDGNGFTFKANTSGDLTVYLIKLIDIGSDSYFTEYIYAEIGGTKQVLKSATNGKSMLLGLESGEKLSDVFTGGSSSVPSNTTFYFRDGYSAE